MKKSLPFFFCILCLAVPTYAQEQGRADYIGARLVTSHNGMGKLPKLEMGLDITLEPGWYTYWRMPGDNGLAPVFDWTKSVNVKEVFVSWPTPKRFTLDDMNSFGYNDPVMFPLAVTPEKTGEEMVVALKADFVVCHDICVPQTLELSKTIPAGKADRSEDYNALRKAEKKIPAPNNMKDLEIKTAVLGKDSVVVTAYAKGGFDPQTTDLIVQTPHSLLSGKPEIIVDEKDKETAILKITAPQGAVLTDELFGKKAAILLIRQDLAVEKDVSF